VPRISVLLPVRDGAVFVERAVSSVLRSTWRDLELVVVDDFSTDDTGEILRRLQESDARIRLESSRRPGLVSAVERGLQACRAPYVARMDADDISAPRRFELQLALLEREGLDGVGGRVRIVDANGDAVGSLQRYEAWVNANRDPRSIAAYRFVESPLVNPTALCRREVFEIGYRDGPWPEDYDFWLRAIAAGFRFGKVDEHVLDWIDRPTRWTRRDARFSADGFDRCRRMHLLEGPLSGVETVDLWGAGETGKPWLRWLSSVGINVRRIYEISPRKIGQKIDGVLMRSPDDLQPADGTPLVIAVGAVGAREWIEERLRDRGHVPGEDVWFVA